MGLCNPDSRPSKLWAESSKDFLRCLGMKAKVSREISLSMKSSKDHLETFACGIYRWIVTESRLVNRFAARPARRSPI